MTLQDETARSGAGDTPVRPGAAVDQRRISAEYAALYQETSASLRAKGLAPGPVMQRVSGNARTWTGRLTTRDKQHLLASESWRIPATAQGEVELQLAAAGYRDVSESHRGLRQPRSISMVEQLRDQIARYLSSLA